MRKQRLLATTALGGASFHARSERGEIREEAVRTTVAPSDIDFDFAMKPQERGVILSNPLSFNGNSVSIESSDIDPSELRRSLLFWDKLVWPSTNGLFIEGGDDVRFLECEGKLVRPRFSVNGEIATALSMSFAETFKILEKLHPGQWVVSHGEKSLKIHGDAIIDGRGMITNFIRAIPIPEREMPLEDLLRFKDGRGDEVAALRVTIDEFYQDWLAAEDQDHQLQLALAKIDAASADMIRVSKESRLPFTMSSWKVNFNITVPDIMKAAALTIGGMEYELSTASSLLIGGLSMVSFGTDVGIRSARKNSPFNYVASMERDLF